jgi:hypothetical protein
MRQKWESYSTGVSLVDMSFCSAYIVDSIVVRL